MTSTLLIVPLDAPVSRAPQVGGMDPTYIALVEQGMMHRGAVHNYL